MDAFTLTDRDTLAGCLSIAEKPGVFLSVQLTAEFPEDQTRVQLLIWGLTETHHRELQQLRTNLYDVQRYLAQNQLTLAVAHPLHRDEDRLNLGHIEKLVLLFRHFQGINATRDPLTSEITRTILTRLTPAKIEKLANRHNLPPTHPEPWRKVLIGGSQDHTGHLVAQAWTEANAQDTAAFLSEIRQGRCTPGGTDGSPFTQAQTLTTQLLRHTAKKYPAVRPVARAFERFTKGKTPLTFTQKLLLRLRPSNFRLYRQFTAAAQANAHISDPDQRTFQTASLLADKLITSKNLIPIALTLAPYLIAYLRLAPDRAWLRQLSHALTDQIPEPHTKRAWFTDTLQETNGVTTTIHKMAAAAAANGHSLTVITSHHPAAPIATPHINFPPIAQFPLPEYETQKLSLPPILQIIDHIHSHAYTEIIISTPGPLGIIALIAARILGIPTAAIYHTDFPQYVRILTDDPALETLTATYLHWFHTQHQTLWVNSRAYRQACVEKGIAPAKLRILPRGIDTQLFNPTKRSLAYWPGNLVLLYVGRISKEKNLHHLTTAWAQLRAPGLTLAIVGDGPYLPELKRRIPDAIFTGTLHSDELATAYASADIFLFPSTTDTFGNVILEAQASGLPCIVTDTGGPQDLIQEGITGHITRSNNSDDFTRAIKNLIDNPSLREAMSQAAHQSVAGRTWQKAAQKFWDTIS